MPFSFVPNVRFAFKEKPPSAKVNQVAENTDYLHDAVTALQSAGFISKTDVITGQITLDNAWSGYITHNRGIQFPLIGVYRSWGSAVYGSALEASVEFTDTTKLRINWYASDGESTIAATLRYVIR